jgi:hypothetical protein
VPCLAARRRRTTSPSDQVRVRAQRRAAVLCTAPSESDLNSPSGSPPPGGGALFLSVCPGLGPPYISVLVLPQFLTLAAQLALKSESFGASSAGLGYVTAMTRIDSEGRRLGAARPEKRQP